MGVTNGSGRGHREMRPRLNEMPPSHLYLTNTVTKP